MFQQIIPSFDNCFIAFSLSEETHTPGSTFCDKLSSADVIVNLSITSAFLFISLNMSISLTIKLLFLFLLIPQNYSMKSVLMIVLLFHIVFQKDYKYLTLHLFLLHLFFLF